MMAWLSDVRHAVRSFSRSPGLVVVAALSLGLAIGANITLFSLFRAIFLRDVTAQDPGRLVLVWIGNGQVSYPDYFVLRGSRALADLAAYRVLSVALRSAEGVERVYVQAVSNNFFDLLGVHPAQGRAFSREDPQAVILSDGCRRRRFGGDPNIVGRIITLNNRPFTVIGVLSPHYRSVIGYGVTPDFYLPLSPLLDPDLNKRENASLQLLGRLAAGVTPLQAESALTPAAQEFARLHPELSRQSIEHRVAGLNSVEKLKRDEGGLLVPVMAFFGLLLVVVGLVLLIACANIGGLLLARGVSRRREIAVRLALGASRGRLIQHLLAESAVLAVLGTATGLLLNLWLAELLSKAPLPSQIPIDLNLTPDFRLLAYSVALCVGAALLSGLAPALQSTRPGLLPALQEKDPPFAGSRFSLRDALVIGQVSVSLLLLVTSSLFLRSLLHLTRPQCCIALTRKRTRVIWS